MHHTQSHIMETIESKKKSHYSVKSNGVATGNIKDVDSASRIVTGFYNTFNFFDQANDVLISGCAKRSIKNSGPNSSATAKIKHALHHDLTQLPGKIITLEEKTIDGVNGIYFETKMADTTLGNDTLKNYLAEVYDNHSIGYKYIDLIAIERENEKAWNKWVSELRNPKETEGKSIMFIVKEIQLFEGSTVSFGCNSLTPFLGMKSTNPEVYKLSLINRIAAFEKVLKKGTQTDEMMENIEIMCLQFKQMFVELCDLIPEGDILGKKSAQKQEQNGIVTDSMITNFTLG